LFPERGTPARDFIGSLQDDDELIGSPLLLAECTSVLRREVFDRRLSHDEAVHRLDVLINLPLRIIDSRVQYSRAMELASQFQHRKAYDMQHLAVAEMESAELATLDRGLRHAAREVGVPASPLR
jgi:predicted nucleic acid-binding protein